MKSVNCRKCNAQMLFVRTAKGHMIPIDYKEEFINDKEFDANKHVSHFATCPYAADFRKAKLKKQSDGKSIQ